MRRITLLLTILLAFSASTSSAIVDSMYANNQTSISVQHPEYAVGQPDGQQAQIGFAGELWLRFDKGGTPLDFAPGSIIHITWSKQSTDSVAAVLSFTHVTTNWIEGKQDSVMIIDQPGMVTVTVPKAGYNAIHFRLTGNPPATDGSKAFFVDGATLIQDNLGVSESGTPKPVFSMYPNPALVQTGITLNAPQEYIGRSEIVIANVLGAEVKRVSVADANQHIDMDDRGTYIAMLIVNGQPVGRGYKFTIE